eukprot:gene11089-7717_t
MLRRVAAPVQRKLAAPAQQLLRTSGAVVESRRHLEPMSVWYLASWTCVWWYAFFFWMPVLYPDLMAPSFVYNKIPVIHFLQEKRAEQKLRRVLDETATEWTTELDVACMTDAIARTF